MSSFALARVLLGILCSLVLTLNPLERFGIQLKQGIRHNSSNQAEPTRRRRELPSVEKYSVASNPSHDIPEQGAPEQVHSQRAEVEPFETFETFEPLEPFESSQPLRSQADWLEQMASWQALKALAATLPAQE